jgi:hypothetical protein
MELSTIQASFQASGEEVRSLKAVGTSNGNLLFESRDRDARILQDTFSLSSRHLESGATRISGKLVMPLVRPHPTDPSRKIAEGSQMGKFEFVVSDNSDRLEREALYYGLTQVLDVINTTVLELEPIHL